MDELMWGFSDATRFVVVGRSRQANARAAADFDLRLAAWVGVVSESAPADYPMVFTRVDVLHQRESDSTR